MASSFGDRARLQAEIEARLAKGWTMAVFDTAAGFPSRQTIFRWAKADPNFAQRLRDAQMHGAAVRRGCRDGHGYHPDKAEAFLARVRAGEAVRDLVRTPGQPHRDALNRWKRERPEFAEALAEATRRARFGRRYAAAYSEALADRVILQLTKGTPLPDLGRIPGMPRPGVVKRWRRIHPELDGAVRVAIRAGHRRRMKDLGRRTPELTEAILAHIFQGDTLHGLSKRPGMPHAVTLYGWMRDDPAFAADVRDAYEQRDFCLLGVARGTIGARSDGYPGRRAASGED